MSTLTWKNNASLGRIKKKRSSKINRTICGWERSQMYVNHFKPQDTWVISSSYICLNNLTDSWSPCASKRWIVLGWTSSPLQNKKQYYFAICISRSRRSHEACNFIKKETLAQVFSCEFCEISKNTFSIEHFQMTASVVDIMFSFIRQNCLTYSFFVINRTSNNKSLLLKYYNFHCL